MTREGNRFEGSPANVKDSFFCFVFKGWWWLIPKRVLYLQINRIEKMSVIWVLRQGLSDFFNENEPLICTGCVGYRKSGV